MSGSRSDRSDKRLIAINLREVREIAEKRAIIRAAGHGNGSITHAAELLGVTRPTWYNLLKKHSLSF